MTTSDTTMTGDVPAVLGDFTVRTRYNNNDEVDVRQVMEADLVSTLDMLKDSGGHTTVVDNRTTAQAQNAALNAAAFDAFNTRLSKLESDVGTQATALSMQGSQILSLTGRMNKAETDIGTLQLGTPAGSVTAPPPAPSTVPATGTE